MKRFLLLTICLSRFFCVWGESLSIRINSRYLNIPISHRMDRKQLTFTAKGEDTLTVVVRIAEDAPDYCIKKKIGLNFIFRPVEAGSTTPMD